MKSIYMKDHFDTIYSQRERNAELLKKYEDKIWIRPFEDKWSYGETYYHLYLMIKRFRQLNTYYLPVSKPIAFICKSKPYPVSSQNVFIEYNEKKKKPMKAPFLLVPPRKVENKISFANLLLELDNATKALEKLVCKIEDKIAGHICYPDPIANNPNLIQSIHLLAIHENHHFQLCSNYYSKNLI